MRLYGGQGRGIATIEPSAKGTTGLGIDLTLEGFSTGGKEVEARLDGAAGRDVVEAPTSGGGVVRYAARGDRGGEGVQAAELGAQEPWAELGEGGAQHQAADLSAAGASLRAGEQLRAHGLAQLGRDVLDRQTRRAR